MGTNQNLKLYVLKDMIKKGKRQPTEWERNFANHIYLIRDLHLNNRKNFYNSIIK